MTRFESYLIAHLERIDRRLRCIEARLAGQDQDELEALAKQLNQADNALRAAVASAGANIQTATTGAIAMANPNLQKLADAVKANTDVVASAVLLINGIADRISAAVTAAIANGATAAELQPVSDEADALNASAAALSAAVAANTPTPPTP